MSSLDPTQPPWTAVNTDGYASPAALGVTLVILTVAERSLHVMVTCPEAAGSDTTAQEVCRLAGGLVGSSESSEAAAERKLLEKTDAEQPILEQLAAFTAPQRDPRGWIPSVAYLALVPPGTEPADDGDQWRPAMAPPALIDDHAEMLAVALERLRGKLWWSNVAVGLLPEEFTLTQARGVYEAISGVEYDPSTFARDLRSTGLIEETQTARAVTGGRPAMLYRFSQREPSWGAGRRKRVGGAGD